MAGWHGMWLEKLVKDLHCDTFDVRIISLSSKVVACRTFTPQQFINAAEWMAAMSSARHHVFFRPDGALAHVLVDDITDDALHLMACDGIKPSAVVKTSQNNFQAWCTLPGRNHREEVHRAAARILAERYSGDPGSAKPSQHGRVPTTRNPKPKRAMADGTPPLVLLRQHGLMFSRRLLDEASEQASNELERMKKQIEVVQVRITDFQVPTSVAKLHAELMQKYLDDRSKVDFELCRTLFLAGDTPDHVASMLMACSGKAIKREERTKGAGVQYVERTVGRAAKAVCSKGTKVVEMASDGQENGPVMEGQG